MGPTGNFQGTYRFLCLNTGECITRRQFNELPVPDSFLKRVEDITKTKSDASSITLPVRHGNKITDYSEYYEEDNNDVHGANTNGNGTVGVVQYIKALPVPDTKILLGTIFKNNEDKDNKIIQVPISARISAP